LGWLYGSLSFIPQSNSAVQWLQEHKDEPIGQAFTRLIADVNQSLETVCSLAFTPHEPSHKQESMLDYHLDWYYSIKATFADSTHIEKHFTHAEFDWYIANQDIS